MKKLKEYLIRIVDNRGKNPNYKISAKYPVIDNGLIKNSLYPDLDNVSRYIDENTYNEFLRGYVHRNMPIMTLVGNGIGNVTLSPSSDVAIVQNTIGFATNELCSEIYLYYYFINNQEKIKSFNRGSGQPSIKKTDILDMEVDFPNIDVQTQIASFLYKLDWKIELNNRINKNLEKQAITFYVNFVSDKPTNGKLGDLIIENQKSKIPVNEAKTLLGEIPYFTSGQAILYINDYIVDGQNIFLNTGGNADIKHYIGKASYSTDTWSIKGIDKLTDYLYILLLVAKFEINDNYFEGSALKHLQKSNLKDKDIYVPTNNEKLYLYNTLHPLMLNITNNLLQNIKLSKIKNLLLPKLMSGEIDVSKVDI